jgi:putative aldouronate transport system substrate-binding protein
MVPYGSNEHDGEEYTEMMYDTIDEYCNTDITWTFYSDSVYWDSLTLIMAANEMPDVFVVNKDTAGWLTAVKYGAFHELTQYLGKGNYPNLDTIPDAVIQNASIDGYLYGIPRSRNLYRNGWGYRLDWVNTLGLDEPKTIDELYDMLVAFTTGDPDGNGIDDTYGLGFCGFNGPLDMFQVMWGAPNGWGIDEKGDLIPAQLTDEYIECLTELRKWYSEGLINPDYDELDAGSWDSALLRNNVAGCTGEVADRFRRNQDAMAKDNPNVLHAIVPGFDVDGDGVIYLMPTTGYSGMICINKQNIDDKEVLGVLNFLDKMNDAEMTNLVGFGVEGKSYYIDENGYGVYYTSDEMTEMGVPTYNWRDGFNQIIPYFHNAEQLPNIIAVEAASEIRQLEANHKAGIWPESYADYTVEVVATMVQLTHQRHIQTSVQNLMLLS